MIWQGKHGVYLIAEIGGNHEGDFDYARKLTQLACQSGVDAVKFQIYTGDTIVSKVEDPTRNQHFKRFELTPDQYISLAEQCQVHSVTFLASVWNINALDWIDPYLTFYKIGSGDLSAYPFIRRIVSRGKPIILSTGLSTKDEVEDVVSFIQSLDDRYKQADFLALLQCSSMYPIPDEDANLNVMNWLRNRFQLTVGYSDHTIGTEAAETAVAMGAEILELHFTDSRQDKSFRDHQVSFTPEEIRQLIEKIKRIKVLQGSPSKSPTESEINANHVVTFRRAVYPVRDLPKGTVITEDDLIILRPNHGIDARQYDRVVGKSVQRDLPAYKSLSWDDLI
jgi:N-acetylneuraminate synthase/N,N'-diacetyllegionaminate synthase